MYLYGITVAAVLVVAVIAWILYARSKKQNKTADKSLKETYDEKYHTFIDDVYRYENSDDAFRFLLDTIQTLTEEKTFIYKELLQVKELQKKTAADLEQKSHEIIDISHQMRTSLFGLLGFVDFLEKTELDDEQDEFVSIIKTSADELLVLINGVIDMVDKPYVESVQLRKEKERFEKPNILVVDDNDINQKLIAKILESENIEVTYASNGQEAVNLSQEYEYDMIFMDVQMPIMDGVDASRAIRRFEKRHNREAVPIVALTADISQADRDKYMDAGMTDYIAKPIMVDDVKKRIAQL